MTVQEFIDELQKIEDKTLLVCTYDDGYGYHSTAFVDTTPVKYCTWQSSLEHIKLCIEIS